MSGSDFDFCQIFQEIFEFKMSKNRLPTVIDSGESTVKNITKGDLRVYCFVSSPWRPHIEDKRMVLEHTHGLFIT